MGISRESRTGISSGSGAASGISKTEKSDVISAATLLKQEERSSLQRELQTLNSHTIAPRGPSDFLSSEDVILQACEEKVGLLVRAAIRFFFAIYLIHASPRKWTNVRSQPGSEDTHAGRDSFRLVRAIGSGRPVLWPVAPAPLRVPQHALATCSGVPYHECRRKPERHSQARMGRKS